MASRGLVVLDELLDEFSPGVDGEDAALGDAHLPVGCDVLQEGNGGPLEQSLRAAGRWGAVPRAAGVALTLGLFPKAAWKGCRPPKSCWMSLRQAILNTSGFFSITSLRSKQGTAGPGDGSEPAPSSRPRPVVSPTHL